MHFFKYHNDVITIQLCSNTNVEDNETKAFVPIARVVNPKTERRYKKTWMKIHAKFAPFAKIMAGIGMPIIYIIFNLIFFFVGMTVSV